MYTYKLSPGMILTPFFLKKKNKKKIQSLPQINHLSLFTEILVLNSKAVIVTVYSPLLFVVRLIEHLTPESDILGLFPATASHFGSIGGVWI